MRYNTTLQRFEISENGGPYKALATEDELASSAGGWTDDGGVVRLTSSSDAVAIGDLAPLDDEKLRVSGSLLVDGGYVQVKEFITAPATPPGGYGRLYEKADGKLYFQNSSGIEYDLTENLPVSGSNTYSAQNRDAVTIKEGQAVAVHSSGSGIVLANSSDDNKNAIGLATEDIAVLAFGLVQVDGVLLVSDWTEITGTVTLTPHGRYFLDTTSGKLTTSPPTAVGTIYQPVGKALSGQRMHIRVDEAIIRA